MLLKTGRPVADVAYYIGEGAPVMTGPRDPSLPDGHDYDFINSDVLIHRAAVVNGRIAVRDGPSYAVLVLPPEQTMPPEVAAAIHRLVRDGATVVGPQPDASPSLAGYPECDLKVKAIAAEIWGGVNGEDIKSRACGKGRIYQGVSLEEVFADLKLEPAARVLGAYGLVCAVAGNGRISTGKQGGIVFKHRAAADHELFLLANTTPGTAEFTASLRVSGRLPELWNPVTGEITPAAAFRQENGRTLVPLRLAPSESTFLVFGKPIAADAAGSADTNTPDMAVVAALDGPWTVRFDGQGAPAEAVFDKLVDWTQHADDNIKHYSGTAAYETKFNLSAAPTGKRPVLAIGEVGVIAKVFVNGIEAGTVWTTPWEINIAGLLKSGENTVAIEVTNTWNNRLVADAAQPAKRRQSYISQANLFKAGDPLLPSGLFGPVRIIGD